MTDIIYTHQTDACRWLSWTRLSTDCACPRIVRWLEEGGGVRLPRWLEEGGGVRLPRCPPHARCPRLVPRLEEGGGVSLPRLEEGGRVSLPVTVVATVGSSDRNCGKKYDFENGSNIHQWYMFTIEYSMKSHKSIIWLNAICHAVSAEWETNKHSSELISGVITMRRLDTLDLS